MKIRIGKGLPSGELRAPKSKSYAHRLLALAALSGSGSVSGVEKCEDVNATLSCLKSLGCVFEYYRGKVYFLCGPNGKYVRTLNCHESGTTLRFMVPIALAIGGKFIFKGSERLLQRGIGEYEKIFADQEIKYRKYPDKVVIEGKLKPADFCVRGDISSQFISGMLLVLPVIGKSTLTVTTEIESRPYVDMTIECMKRYGIDVLEENGVFRIDGGKKNYAPKKTEIEGDWSNAAFFEAFSALGADVKVTGTSEESLQGDKACKEIFARAKEGFFEADLSDCPDLAPVLFAFAGATHGGKFTGTKRLKLKESDRAEVMKEELSKFGVNVEVGENEVTVNPPEKPISEQDELKVPLFSHGDHRIAMALTVISTLCGAELDGAEAIEKSFPAFYDLLKKRGVNIEYEA